MPPKNLSRQHRERNTERRFILAVQGDDLRHERRDAVKVSFEVGRELAPGYQALPEAGGLGQLLDGRARCRQRRR